MANIKDWSRGDDMIFEAIHIAELQGNIIGKIEANGNVEDWEQDWFIERVNKTLTKFDIPNVKTLGEALSYKLTCMPLKQQGIALIEKFGQDCGAMRL